MPQKPLMKTPTRAKHILELSKEEKQEFLDSFDTVFSDCDGVIWMFLEPIPNTGAAILLLKQAGKTFRFISNNSMRTDQEYQQKLAAIGVNDVSTSDLVHPVKTITHYVKKHLPSKAIFSLCSHEVNNVFRQNGVNLKTMQQNTRIQSTDLISIIKPQDEVAAVIIDLNFNFTFGELARAHQYLQQENCQLLVGAADGLVPVTKDFVTLGCADFINLLSERSGKTPVLLGKPGSLLSAHLIEQFEVSDPKRALFIGDNLVMDIKFGLSSGFKTLFVLSGASTYEDMLQTPSDLQPDYVADSLADFVEIFKDLNA